MAGSSSRGSSRRPSSPITGTPRSTLWATCASCSPWTIWTTRSPGSADTARRSSTKWSSTKTCIGSATSAAPRAFSSGWPSKSADAAMSSWYDGWADRYAEWSTGGGSDIPFYVCLAREADGPLVELAVGNGRVAIPVAQATGRRVIGIDSSPAMLEQARVRAAEDGVELDLRAGDIRELEVDDPAALIYCPGRSLLHLPTWADRRRCFERVAASLLPRGRFAWNAFAFDHHIASALDGQHADANTGIPLPHANHYSVGDNRVDIALDDGGTGSLWWATKNEWLGLLDVAGLRLEALYGGFNGEPLDDDSREYIFVARR